jgi:hypothetical protein
MENTKQINYGKYKSRIREKLNSEICPKEYPAKPRIIIRGDKREYAN